MYSIEHVQETLTITLSGKLDTNSAPPLMDELNQYIGKAIHTVIFDARALSYISSAGIRVVVFAKQKLGEGLTLRFVGTAPEVKDVFEMTGLTDFITFVDA